MQKSFKHILVDEQNYDFLKKLGQAGDSFNDIISRLVREGAEVFTYPKTFDDFYQLQRYFEQRGAQIIHKTIGSADFATITITSDRPIPKTFNLFFRKVNDKFQECTAAERTKQENSEIK